MYKVLIVDDERLIREGLRTIVDWEAYGFAVADSAADGVEALAKISRDRPDLVVADIRMPGMDGLEMIRTLQAECDHPPHFLLLSGYADFNYAREALLMRADGYLLKPVDEEELVSHLEKIKLRLDGEAGARGAAQDLTPERVIEAALRGETGRRFERAAAEAGLAWPAYEVLLTLPLSRREIAPAELARVGERLAETFRRDGRGVTFAAERGLGFVLRREDLSPDPLLHASTYRKLAEACAEAGLDCTVVSGGAVTRLDELPASLCRAEALLRASFFLGGGRIHDKLPEPADPEHGEASAWHPDAVERMLIYALDVGDADAAIRVLSEAFLSMVADRMTEPAVKTAFAQIVTAAVGNLARRHPALSARSHAFSAELFALHDEYRYDGMLDRLAGLVRAVADALGGAAADQPVRKMTELIHRNYRENLKLETFADMLNYNSSYLGKLFKAETGDSFHTYLDKVRMDKAKELLEMGMKVYQVAEQVGYANVDYFHAKFRKYVGTSPTAYRKQ